MTYRRTPPLSEEGTREILEEMSKPAKDTPERRAMEERVKFMEAVRKRSGADERLPPLLLPPLHHSETEDETGG